MILNRESDLWKTIMFGALGDAMGYQIEFLKDKDIDLLYEGNVTYEKLVNENLEISDDTQMAMYTLEAILKDPSAPLKNIYLGYMDWAWTQLYAINSNITLTHPCVSELSELEEMRQSRAPGMTCMHSLMSGVMGTHTKRINDSKGCGGVMRVAPLAVYYASMTERSEDEISRLAVDSACITHGHNMNIFSTYNFANLLVNIVRNKDISLEELVQQSLEKTVEEFSTYEYIDDYSALIKKSIKLSKIRGDEDRGLIHQLGEGWIAEEAVAIAFYSAIKYQSDLKKALSVSVNHKGDSDSTGILTGNILGLLVSNIDDYIPTLKTIKEYEILDSFNI